MVCDGCGVRVGRADDLGDVAMKGLDYSWSRPGGAAIKEAGFEFVMRYVPYFGDGNKGLRADELADLRANGLAIGLVWETTAGRALEGEAAGREDATVAAKAAADIGFPTDLPIYFAVDFDAQPFHYQSIRNYLFGAEQVLGVMRVGVYGSYAVVEHCHEAGCAVWYWQTYAWSGGRKSDWRHVYQYENGQTLNGGAVDYNEAYGEAGLWKPEEEEMTPEDFERLFDKRFEERMAVRFPNWLAAAFEDVSYKFSDRPDIQEAPMQFPYKPWLDDIAARVRTIPGVTRE